MSAPNVHYVVVRAGNPGPRGYQGPAGTNGGMTSEQILRLEAAEAAIDALTERVAVLENESDEPPLEP